MKKRTMAWALVTRDEKGQRHIKPCPREYAHNIVKGSCVTLVRRGMGGERHVVLANGCTFIIDLLTPRQLRANGL